MKAFLKRVAELGIVGILAGLIAQTAGLDPMTSKAIGAAAEQASDHAIERHVGGDE